MPNEKLKKTDAKTESPAGKSPEEIRDEIQRKNLQFQILQANMQMIHEREHSLSHRLDELAETRHAIEDVKKVKPGSELLVPLGSGNFVSGKISDTGKILVGVGGGIAIKKSPEGALKFLEERAAETGSALQELEKQFMHMEAELRKMQSVAQ